MKNVTIIFVFCFFCNHAFAQTGTLEERSFMQGDSLRSYLLYVPAAYDGSSDWPLVLSYHGGSIDGAFQKDVDRLDLAADTAHFLLAYPEGLIANDPFDGPVSGWNYDGNLSENDDVAFTSQLIDHVISDYSIDPSRVHATGWSMGSQMLWSLACELDDKIASIAGVSGPMDDAYMEFCKPQRSVSVMLIHGTDDPFIPAEGFEINGYVFGPPAETLEFWGNENDCAPDSLVTQLEDISTDDSTTVTLFEYTQCDDDTEVQYYQVNDGGHQWPGGLVIFPDFLGRTNNDIDANTEILAFFNRNPLPEAQGGVLEERSFVHNDSLRSYLLYVPTAYDGSADWPLVINYHGFNSTADSQVGISQMNRAADSVGYLIAYPQGLMVNNPFLNVLGPGWNLLDGSLSENDDIDFSLELISDVASDFSVNLEGVHVTGWSMGAGLAYEVACGNADKIASFAAVAEQVDDGTMANCSPERAISFLQIHGTADPIVPFAGAAAGGVVFSEAPMTAAFFAGINNCSPDSVVTEIVDVVAEDSSTVSLASYEGCDDETEVLFYQVDNGGHTWPGGGALPGFLGFVNRDFDASLEMLHFFSRNTLPSLSTSNGTETLPGEMNLHIYPNPFAEHFTISLDLPQATRVKIMLFDVLGREVSKVVDQAYPAGQQQIDWRSSESGIPSGLYFLRIKAEDQLLTRPVIHIFQK